MEYIYEVLMFVHDEDSDEVEEWTDSWWTTREAAIEEADSMWDSIGDDHPNNEIRIIRRRLNVSGYCRNLWDEDNHQRVKFYSRHGERVWDENSKRIIED